MFAGRFIDYDKLAHILTLQLLISIQKLNPINRPVRCHIHHKLVAQPDSFDLSMFFPEADIAYVISWVICEFHNAVSARACG